MHSKVCIKQLIVHSCDQFCGIWLAKDHMSSSKFLETSIGPRPMGTYQQNHPTCPTVPLPSSSPSRHLVQPFILPLSARQTQFKPWHNGHREHNGTCILQKCEGCGQWYYCTCSNVLCMYTHKSMILMSRGLSHFLNICPHYVHWCNEWQLHYCNLLAGQAHPSESCQVLTLCTPGQTDCSPPDCSPQLASIKICPYLGG